MFEITIPGEERNAVYIFYKFENGECFADFIDKKPIEDKELFIMMNAVPDREKKLNDV